MLNVRSPNRIPAVLLAQPFRRSNRWLSKKPEKWYSAPTMALVPALVPTEKELNELRFWSISPSGASHCRACNLIEWTAADRQRHQADSNCTKVLVQAYRLLLRDMKCVVCDGSTQHTKFGVPLCQGCVSKFEKESGQPALLQAIRLVKMVQ